MEQRDGSFATGWALDGVPISVLIEVEGRAAASPPLCKGSLVAIGPDGSVHDVDDIVAGLAAW